LFMTNGNPVADCDFGAIEDVESRDTELARVPVAQEHGLPAGMVDDPVYGTADCIDNVSFRRTPTSVASPPTDPPRSLRSRRVSVVDGRQPERVPARCRRRTVTAIGPDDRAARSGTPVGLGRRSFPDGSDCRGRLPLDLLSPRHREQRRPPVPPPLSFRRPVGRPSDAAYPPPTRRSYPYVIELLS
jgi:hypothetical protein